MMYASFHIHPSFLLKINKVVTFLFPREQLVTIKPNKFETETVKNRTEWKLKPHASMLPKHFIGR